jgi:hypothetical protein
MRRWRGNDLGGNASSEVLSMILKTIVGLMLMAAAASLVLGIVSYRHGIPDNAIWISFVESKPRVQAAMTHGVLHVVYSVPDSTFALGKRGARAAGKKELRLGSFYLRKDYPGNAIASGIGLPFWLITVILLIGPAMALARGPIRRRRRRKRGECLRCGYNLNGLTEPRCPECGRPFELRPNAVTVNGSEGVSRGIACSTSGPT